MDTIVAKIFPYVFPFVFVGFWLWITRQLGQRSGWLELAKRFPNQAETSVLTLRGQSGFMGERVSFSGCLKFPVCASGLRIGVFRVMGPFSRDFFVPWKELSVATLDRGVDLRFGKSMCGSLRVSVEAANRLARAAGAHWPARGALVEPTVGAVLGPVWSRWAIASAIAGGFFVLTSLSWSPRDRPALAILIVAPAIFFGIGPAIRSIVYLLRRRDVS